MRIPALIFVASLVVGASAQTEVNWLSPQLHDGVVGIVDGLERRWARFETPYVRVLAADASAVTPAALRELSVFVESCLDRLEVAPQARAELRRRPIRYLLCKDADDIRWFGGVEADGVALPRQRLVLTHILPHEHELAHVLADLAVVQTGWDRPRQTFANDPLLQEGLAGYLGGRRGHAPDALQQAAEHYLTHGMGNPFRLLGWAEFHDPKWHPDMRYAVGARLVAFLVDRDGMARFLRLYRTLAASPMEARRRPQAAILLQLEGHYDAELRELHQEFAQWRRMHPPLGPRVVERPQREPDRVLALDARQVEMWEGAQSWIFHVRADAGYPDVTLRYGESLAPSGGAGGMLGDTPELRYSLMLRPEDVRLTDLAHDRLLSQGSTLRPERDEVPSAFTVELPRAQVGDIGECWISASPRIKRE